MKEGIKAEIKNTFEDYEKNERKVCLLRHCAMSILAVEMTNWTHSLENNIIHQEMKKCVSETQKYLR